MASSGLHTAVIVILTFSSFAVAVLEVRRNSIPVRSWVLWAVGAIGIIIYCMLVQRWIGVLVGVFTGSIGFLGFRWSDQWAARMRDMQQIDDD